jgi:short-subunit dehydrogenase
MTKLQDARILLTGASSGIGWALAHRLAQAKARIVLAARSTDRLQQLAAGLQPHGTDVLVVPTDVTNPEHRTRLVDETVRAFQGIDILINNAGVGASGFFREASEARLREIFEVNFFGATELTRLALPHITAGPRAMIVNVSSVIGRRGVPGHSEYCSSKFAMSGWSESLRAELKLQGIHVLLVCPGLIATPFREHQVEDRLRFTWQKDHSMSPDACARRVVTAIRKRKSEIVITFDGKLLVLANRFVPRIVDWFAVRYARRVVRV